MSIWNLRRGISRCVLMGFAGIGVSSAAHAANNLTQAGTSVSNTFELSYSVSGTAQPVITNDSVSPPPGAVVQGTPTLFTVDRKVDLIVTATNSPLSRAPGTTATLTYTLLNEGNDTSSYSFSVADLDNGAGTFDAGSIAVEYLLDANDNATADDGAYTPIATTVIGAAAGSANVTVDVPKGVRVFIRVTGTVAPGTPDAATDDVILVAEARNPTDFATETVPPADEGAVTLASTGANTLTGAAQNVLADGTGVSAAETTGGDNTNPDGLYAATGRITVASPDLDASKTVLAIKEPGIADPFVALTDCATATAVANAKAIPGACIEYIIEVENTGATASADNLVITDNLPAEVTFIGATLTNTGSPGAGFVDDPGVADPGGIPGPTLNAPASGTSCDGPGGTACEVTLSNALLAAGNIGQIRIRALVK